jgi:hypothetical protein
VSTGLKKKADIAIPARMGHGGIISHQIRLYATLRIIRSPECPVIISLVVCATGLEN